MAESVSSADSARQKVKVELTGVPETMLWTLYTRALGASRAYGALHDPLAATLVDNLDYPFAARFGEPDNWLTMAQAERQARRVRCFDLEIERFLARRPNATVVALGEGLETQFWRVDNGTVQWLTVDLPETAALRERVLPASPRQRVVVGSALDHAWMDHVDAASGVLITAQGLLMYLPPPEVRRLIAACAARFPGGELVLDAVPRHFARRATQGRLRGRNYQAPPMPWGMNADEWPRLREVHPNIVAVRELPWPPARGRVQRALTPLARRLPRLGVMRMSVVALRFGDAGTA